MKTLEEKRKEIEELCQNLDENKIEKVYLDLKCNFIINMHWVSGVESFNLTYDNDYYKLIKYLQENQKQPELYTWQEIDRVGKKWIEERHTIKEHTSVFDFLKNNIKPYKKQS